MTVHVATAPTAVPPASSPPLTRVTRAWRRHPGLWALLVWLACLPGAFVLPGLVDESPFGLRGAGTPMVVGAALLTAVAAAAHRRRTGAVAGGAAGALAGWVALTMRTGLFGTPYPFITGEDTTRLLAMAERYTTTLHSADGIVAAVPSEYPPLLPWLVGRLSVLTGAPAWRLVAPAEVVLASAIVVAGFLLWRRVVSDWLALGVALVTFAVFLDPSKAYESLALEVSIPWALATFTGAHGRRPLHWAAAGLLGGLQILLYQGYLMFFALGIVALIVIEWRRSPRRAAYVRRLVRVALVAGAVASWYVVPYVSWALSHGLQATDRYPDPLIDTSPFPFLSLTGPSGWLTAVGVIGLAWYRTRRWWAMPLICLTLSAYVYRFFAEMLFIGDGQTLVFQYTVHAVTATLAAAGVLTLATAVPAAMRRLTSECVDLAPIALVALVLWIATMAWSEWIPGAAAYAGFPAVPGTGTVASYSFLQPLPDGRYPRFAPATGRFAWFPTDPIVDAVRSVRGARTAPLTLSFSEQLFAFRPWPGYIGVGANAAASTEHWFSRLAALRRLASITAPRAFARASAHTPWGAIDVFVLQADGPRWDWTATNAPATVQFTPAQFASPAFAVFRDLPDGTELAVRRPTR